MMKYLFLLGNVHFKSLFAVLLYINRTISSLFLCCQDIENLSLAKINGASNYCECQVKFLSVF